MNDARQQMLERIGEDESLTGDLAGAAAEQLRQWANDTALAIANREDLDDEQVQRQIRAVRTAARTAAAHDGDLVVAQRELTALIDVAPAPAVVEPSAHLQPDATSATPTPTMPVVAPASQPILVRVRGWWRSMWTQAPKEE